MAAAADTTARIRAAGVGLPLSGRFSESSLERPPMAPWAFVPFAPMTPMYSWQWPVAHPTQHASPMKGTSCAHGALDLLF